MALGRFMPLLGLSADEIQQLQSIAQSLAIPYSIVQRTLIILACGDGDANTFISQRMGLTGMTIGKWRKRYRQIDIEGQHVELRSGRPCTYQDEKASEMINRRCRACQG
ncbi:helix-turn-helix domain-containing protein [Synechococcus sp. Cruz-9H2]|uniref:hypothetical protein n=1 Tax=unclassified Synechococcus TaxID=2626047 RepID=UPI0020CDE0C1|nr:MULTISPECIES: hypothetical protein [unclassified Synechococcus]MCP9818400.1 helix-turn-helix domain-containing protein [Synechococcus sp. Cruz-9H2]MCP9842629.1 helix-turn-helix domain-containing protein [Synechococcus sp. Edmonson 11F2]MCP9855293.1 helix-turn-helix domain-containing protein [Synechococcus sp. Cruz-9C9]MCP9862459.1 helix-turn-helix domain-containing protein [Synechococcus sp. Cruz-7E5]MCP9869731.1 helix-turn-helix domain-containing protein [Synechococcus sp. Cruz-7B9]